MYSHTSHPFQGLIIVVGLEEERVDSHMYKLSNERL